MAHVIKTLQDNLLTTPSSSYGTPPVLGKLIEQGAGPEERRGLRQEGRRDILRLDPARPIACPPAAAKAEPIVERMLKKAPTSSSSCCVNDQPAGAVPVGPSCAIQFPTTPQHLADIADCGARRRLCDALGPVVQQGPFELWQCRLEAGGRIGSTKTSTPVRIALQRAAARLGVRRPRWGGIRPKALEPAEGRASHPAPGAAVTQRQHFPENVAGTNAADPPGEHLSSSRTRKIRVWTLDGQSRHRLHHRQAAPDQPGRDRRAWSRPSRSPKLAPGPAIWSPDDVLRRAPT